MARCMFDAGPVQDLGSGSERAIGEVLNNAGIGDGVKGSVLDIGYSPPSSLRRYKRWFR